jgi:hypothetical protein
MNHGFLFLTSRYRPKRTTFSVVPDGHLILCVSCDRSFQLVSNLRLLIVTEKNRLGQALRANSFNKVRHNGITKECIIRCNIFEYIQQTVDSVDGPNDRNQTLFGVNFVFDSFGNLISRWGPDCCMRIFEVKLRLAFCYNMIKLISSLARQNFEQFRRKYNPFGFLIAIESVRSQA